jgi:hypothetical protein
MERLAAAAPVASRQRPPKSAAIALAVQNGKRGVVIAGGVRMLSGLF